MQPLTLSIHKEIKTDTIPKNNDVLEILLKITEQTVLKYLYSFDEANREEKAIEALRVGVIAIQSASPSLDTRIVEEKFRDVETSIDEYLKTFQSELKDKLENYFKAESGEVPRKLEDLLGKTGILSQIFKSYFNSESGQLQLLLQNQIGPSSSFAKNLDRNNKESVISKLENFIETHLELTTGEIVDEFSLDKDGSALSKLKKSLSDEVKEIQKSNALFFVELKEALGIKEGRETEAEKGTEKGREFEKDLYAPVASVSRQLGDTSEFVRAITGKVPRAKVGDYVLTLGNTSGAPNLKIVVEVKKEQNYKLKDAINELKEAKENREADAGIFVFAKGYEPAEVGDFHKLGNDFYITVDEEQLAKNEPLLFFEAAYKIIRVMLITSSRIQEAKEIDKEKIKRELDEIVKLTERISEILTKASTISNSSKFITETATTLKTDLETRLNGIISQLL